MNKKIFTLATVIAMFAALLALGAKVAGLCNQSQGGMFCSGKKGHKDPHTFTRSAAK